MSRAVYSTHYLQIMYSIAQDFYKQQNNEIDNWSENWFNLRNTKYYSRERKQIKTPTRRSS